MTHAEIARRARVFLITQDIERRRPYPGQRYKHGWIPVGTTARFADAVSGDRALAVAAPRRALTDEENRAFDWYGGDASYNINAALREDAGGLSKLRRPERHGPIIAALDSVMEDSPLPEDVVVYRKVTATDVLGDDAEDVDLTGRTFMDHAYSSTSVSRRELSGARMTMRIFVPAGTPAASHRALDGDEILLGRGLTFRVVADPDHRPGGRLRQIDVEVIPPAT